MQEAALNTSQAGFWTPSIRRGVESDPDDVKAGCIRPAVVVLFLSLPEDARTTRKCLINRHDRRV